jgi:hypothetical protein
MRSRIGSRRGDELREAAIKLGEHPFDDPGADVRRPVSGPPTCQTALWTATMPDTSRCSTRTPARASSRVLSSLGLTCHPVTAVRPIPRLLGSLLRKQPEHICHRRDPLRLLRVAVLLRPLVQALRHFHVLIAGVAHRSARPFSRQPAKGQPVAC